MMLSRSWRRVLIEVYKADGYRGCYESPAEPKYGGYDPQHLQSIIAKFRSDFGYQNASLVYCEEDDTLIIGVFDGVHPPSEPKRGTPYIPEFFDEQL